MAGIKQHFIPQLLQRGFEASKSGKHSQVWVFRKGQAAYKSSTEGVAAQRHFYSEPSLDEDALDNIITRYEKEVLTPAVDGLRSAPPGQVEPDAAASVVSHLSIRAAFVRGAFSEVTKKFLDYMSQVLASDESARAYMGIDSFSKDSVIDKFINESLAEDAAMLSETARHRLGRMVRFRFREHFHADFTSMADLFDMQIERFAGVTSSAIENGHIRALEREIVPLKRTELLKSLHWKLVLVPENSHVILPDCLALASDHADLSHPIPYTLADDDALASVLMPVSSSRVLIGSRTDVVIDWKNLNTSLARSSLEFFISSRNDMEMVDLAQQIGHAVSSHSQKLLEKDAFDAPAPHPERGEPTVARLVPLIPVVEFSLGSLSNCALETAIQAQLHATELAPYLDHLRAIVELATHQVVKGSEFPHVMVVMDDSEAGGFLFSYDKLFGAKELSSSDKTNAEEGKETSIDRTLRLLYVTCSRAEESLALVLWASNPSAAAAAIKATGWFHADEVAMLA